VGRKKPLELRDGAAISRSPWWIDANHAPPGGGYCHLLFALFTSQGFDVSDAYRKFGGTNNFTEGGFPTDFTNAKMALRLKGRLDAKGTRLLLLVQAKVGDIAVNFVLTGQPFDVTPEWSDQTVALVPDHAQWLCLGSRHDLTDVYGYGDIAEVLRDVNVDILLVLHPVDVVPAEPTGGDPHMLYAGRDYTADATRLPEGCVMLDEVRVEFTTT
jgi:hypothetical protein